MQMLRIKRKLTRWSKSNDNKILGYFEMFDKRFFTIRMVNVEDLTCPSHNQITGNSG